MQHLSAASLIALLALAPANAHALWGDAEGNFGLNSSLRHVAGVTHNYESALLFGNNNRSDALSQSILRIVGSGKPHRNFGYKLHAVGLLSTSSAPNLAAQDTPNLLRSFGPSDGRYRIVEAQWDWNDKGNDVAAILFVDRFMLRWSVGPLDIRAGRQAISFGKAHFWNPLDVFLPFEPYQFDRDYKAGVDALRTDIALGDFSGLTLVASLGHGQAPGDTSFDAPLSWYGTALLARAYTTLADWDFSLQAGKVLGGSQLGGAVLGEIATIQWRAEVAWFTPQEGDPLPRHTTAVSGITYQFDNGLLFEAEYLYNGSGNDDDLIEGFNLLGQRRHFQAGEHFLGLAVRHDVQPTLALSLGVIMALTNPSALIQPGVVWSAADEIELLAGVIINVGDQPNTNDLLTNRLPSEFGSLPSLGYLEVKFYF